VIEFSNCSVRRVFVEHRGLRVGWSLALYVSLLAVLVESERNVLGPLLRSGLWAPLWRELGALAATCAGSMVMARIERRRWDDYGLPIDGALFKASLLGGVWGLMAVSLLMLVLRALGAFDFGHITLQERRLARRGGRRAAWNVSLPHAAANRQLVVCGRIPRVVGLGGKLPLLSSRQWRSGTGPPTRLVVSRLYLAHGRRSRT
jgi:hypothetical protein